jgi:hypothetical protein
MSKKLSWVRYQFSTVSSLFSGKEKFLFSPRRHRQENFSPFLLASHFLKCLAGPRFCLINEAETLPGLNTLKQLRDEATFENSNWKSAFFNQCCSINVSMKPDLDLRISLMQNTVNNVFK